MKVKNIRIHNRPAYNSEVHATRDMGVGELNNCYEDAELADTIVAVGTNALETQTNYFLNHWIPNLRGTSLDKKKAEFGAEPVEQGTDHHRRSAAHRDGQCLRGRGRQGQCPAPRDQSGTDLALFNAWLTYIADKGWVDKAFIAASTKDFDKVVAANKTSLEDAARITGLTVDEIRKAAEWIAEPKEGGARRRTMFAYEKGLIWGNDNYRTNGALVNVALATGNIGRAGGGCVRMGGHQEGYSRPSDAHVGRPAAYVDKLLIEGKGGVHHIWACDHYKTTLNALKFKQAYKKRTDMVKDAMIGGALRRSRRAGRGDHRRDQEAAVCSRSTSTSCRPRSAQACHVWLPAATSGEMNLTSMNGERRMRLTERYMDPPGQAMPDCLIAARIANHMERVLREQGEGQYADQFKGFDWKTEEDAFMDGYHKHEKGGRVRHLRAPARHGHQRLPGTGDRLQGRQDRRHQAPLRRRQVQGQGRQGHLHGDEVARSAGARQGSRKKKLPFLINNGRTNIVWQNAYLDQDNEFVMDRWPYPFIQMNPDDMAELKVKQGDLVEVYNDNGSTQAMVYPTPTAKQADLHAVRLSDRRAGQRRLAGRQRVHHPELQADLGRDPKDCRCAGRRAASDVQVPGVQRRLGPEEKWPPVFLRKCDQISNLDRLPITRDRKPVWSHAASPLRPPRTSRACGSRSRPPRASPGPRSGRRPRSPAPRPTGIRTG